jgi:hypothetical protein
MEKLTLEHFIKIIGLGSASGLIYQDQFIFLISDNSSFLYKYGIIEKELIKIPLLANSLENIRKKDKYDFESIVLKDKKLHLLGSGSTPKRHKRISYDLENSAIEEKDLSKLYKQLKQISSISDDELNIEGAIYNNKKWCLFQRGNGINSKNGVFVFKSLKKSIDFEFIGVQLPKIKQYETSFTDAILVDDKIYFLATAENTTSTYTDGEILGSIIGRMNSNTFEIEFTQKISNTQKYEGLTLYHKTENEQEFLICEDNDTNILESNIFKLTIITEKNE